MLVCMEDRGREEKQTETQGQIINLGLPEYEASAGDTQEPR